MVTRNDYTADAVEAARSVLVELVHLLGEYRDDIVLIGGWIPEILLSREDRAHVGSMDVDLALDHRHLEEEGYRNIRELLLNRGYREGKQPFIFFRDVDDRLKEKDAWDIYFCIRNFPGGVDALVQEFLPHLQHGLVQEGLEKIAKHFATESHLGPKFVADFDEAEVQEERDLVQRDAYERISSFLKNIGIP